MLFKRSSSPAGKGSQASWLEGMAVSRQVMKNSKKSSDFILSVIQDGVVMVNRENLIQLFNPGASAITGWPANEAVGLDFHNVLPITDEHGVAYPPANHPFAQALATNKTVRDSKGWLATRGGKKIPVSIIVSPLVTDKDQIADTVVGIVRDTASEKAEEKQRSDFISTASHEMRTPVAAIEGYLALAQNPKIAKIDPNARNLLEKASASTKHLGVLFQDLLTSSRAEDGRLASYPKVVEVGELVQQVADAGRFNARKKNLELRYVLSNDNDVSGAKVVRPLYFANVDPNRLSEVMQNLVDNAIKYTPEGSITMRLTGDGSTVQIQIQDTGSGIASEDIPHLFQKFYRVDSSLTRSVSGTGLGLFISRKIIEMYQGRVWVESELGKGSTFFINLPRLNTDQALATQRQQSANSSPLDTH